MKNIVHHSNSISNIKLAIFTSCFLFLLSCKTDQQIVEPISDSEATVLLFTPKGFPKMKYDEDNEFSLDRWKLGKSLFYDPILSIDSTISCASCHNLASSFSDNVAFSLGVKNRIGTRNSPSLANIGYHPYFLREGSVPTLEMQVLVPIQEFNEFNHNIVEISNQLKNNNYYSTLSNKAYGKEIDPYVITRSIGVFERTLISGNSKFDQYLYQGMDVMNADEIEGMNLFFSNKTNCSSCHSGFNLTNYAFENNGLYNNYKDVGRYRLTNDSSDLAKFKVPSLRNIELTAPYMHDGSISNLEQVIDHYNNGGAIHKNKSTLIKPLNLTDSEKAKLLLFLNTLTDYNFVNNPYFKQN